MSTQPYQVILLPSVKNDPRGSYFWASQPLIPLCVQIDVCFAEALYRTISAAPAPRVIFL